MHAMRLIVSIYIASLFFEFVILGGCYLHARPFSTARRKGYPDPDAVSHGSPFF